MWSRAHGEGYGASFHRMRRGRSASRMFVNRPTRQTTLRAPFRRRNGGIDAFCRVFLHRRKNGVLMTFGAVAILRGAVVVLFFFPPWRSCDDEVTSAGCTMSPHDAAPMGAAIMKRPVGAGTFIAAPRRPRPKPDKARPAESEWGRLRNFSVPRRSTPHGAGSAKPVPHAPLMSTRRQRPRILAFLRDAGPSWWR